MSREFEGGGREASWLTPKEMLLDTRRKDNAFWEARIHDLINHEMDLQRQNRFEQQQDFRIYEGGEMPYDELAEENPKYKDLRTNFMRVAGNYMITAAQNMEVVGRIHPAEGRFTKEHFKKVAAEYDKRLTSIRQHVDWRSQWDRAIADAIVTGEGWLKEGVRLTENGKHFEFYLMPVDYRNVWVDHTSSDPGCADAAYLFHVKQVDITRAIARFPNHQAVILDYAYETKLQHTTDADIAYDIDNPTPNVFHDAVSSRYGGGSGSLKVNIGEAFFKTFDMSRDIPVIRPFNFLADEGYSRVYMLRMPKTFHGHNRIPFTRITPARFRENNLPFSPMTRLRRGYERVMTALMRTGVRMAASRAVMLDVKSITKESEKSLPLIRQEYKQEMASGAPVLFNYGDPGSMKIENLAVDLQKTTSMFEMLMRLSEVQAQVDPSLLGQETNVTAGVSLEMKREEALNSFPELRTCIKQGVRSMTERMLSLCEQYDEALHYPALVGEDGQPIPVTDGDFTLAGNRVLYHVDLRAGSRTVMREQAANLQAVLQKMDPETSQLIFPLFVDMLGIPDGGRIKNLIIDSMMLRGVQFAPGVLNEEQRKRQEQTAARQQQVQQQQVELAMETAASEIDLNEAKTVEAHAKAMKTIDEIGQDAEKEEKKEETKASSKKRDDGLLKTIREEIEATLGGGKGDSPGKAAGEDAKKPEGRE